MIKHTHSDTIEIVTLKKFLDKIKIQYSDQDLCSCIVSDGLLSYTIKCVELKTLLHKGNSVEFFKSQILEDLNTQKVECPHSLVDEIEDRSCQYIMQNPLPRNKHAVSLGERRWLLSSPEDFMIFKRGNRYRIICLHEYRNKIYQYRKTPVYEIHADGVKEVK